MCKKAPTVFIRSTRSSGGTAVMVSDAAMLDAVRRIGRTEGIFACPEGGATLAAFEQLRDAGWIKADDRVLLMNTGGGDKYAHLMASDT